MFKPLPLCIGLRYTRARRRNHFISFSALASMLGIAVGVMALITVLSVMNGFEKELRHRILGVVSHATIEARWGAFADWQDVARRLQARPEIKGSAPFINGQAMLANGPRVTGSLLRGVLPGREPEVSELAKKMIQGRLDELRPGAFNIILGNELAAQLGVGVGDRIMVVTPQATVSPVGMLPRLRRFTVSGIFSVGMYEYDSGLALLHLDDAARLYRLEKGTVTGLRLRLANLFEAPQTAANLNAEIPPGYRVIDWTQRHANFFRAVHMEKIVMTVILFLIVAVAAFNLISTLVMMVSDKRGDVAILRTMGASPAAIMTIFVVQGAVTGIIGTLIGVVLGVALAENIDTVVPAIEQLMGIKFLAADVYYINELPSDMRWFDVMSIALTAVLLCLCATLYPAWRAARTAPAEALRYE